MNLPLCMSAPKKVKGHFYFLGPKNASALGITHNIKIVFTKYRSKEYFLYLNLGERTLKFKNRRPLMQCVYSRERLKKSFNTEKSSFLRHTLQIVSTQVGQI